MGTSASRSRASRARQVSRSPPSAYRIRSVAVRPGGPYRLCATSASVRWPTMSRPSRTHDRRASSSRMPVAWSTAVVSPPRKPGRVEDEQQGLRAPGERGESMEAVGDLRRRVRAGQPPARQIQHEQVHRPTGEQAARDRQALVQAGRGDDHEPFESKAAGDRLDRVEAARQVQPGDDRPPRLGLRRGPQRERRPAAGPVATERDAGRGRQATRAEDRIERREPGVDDPPAGERLDGRTVDLVRGRRGARARAPRTRGAAAPQRARRPATACSTSPRGVVIGRR